MSLGPNATAWKLSNTLPTQTRTQAVDPQCYPLLAGYMRNLPLGIHSYPHCAMVSDAARRLQSEYASLWDAADLPKDMQAALTQPWKEGDFVPLTVVTAQSLILQDRLGLTQEQYLQRAQGVALQILKQPLYRNFLAVLSPQTLLLGLTWRWEKFYRGVKLMALGGDRYGHKVVLKAPPGIFTDTWCKFLCATFYEVLLLTHAKRPRVTHHCISETDTVFMLRWE